MFLSDRRPEEHDEAHVATHHDNGVVVEYGSQDDFALAAIPSTPCTFPPITGNFFLFDGHLSYHLFCTVPFDFVTNEADLEHQRERNIREWLEICIWLQLFHASASPAWVPDLIPVWEPRTWPPPPPGTVELRFNADGQAGNLIDVILSYFLPSFLHSCV